MYKNSKYTVLFPLLLAAGVVLGLLLGQYMGRNSTTSEIKGMLRQMALPTNKLTYTLSLIENQYVDSVAMDSLAEHVIPLLVKELDPHSVYIPASEMQEINEPLEGEFDGIGVVFNMATDTVIVLNVIPQGPSDKAGIKAGDRIIEINDTLVAGQKIPQRDVVKKLRGPRARPCTSGWDARVSPTWWASTSCATRFRSRVSNRRSALPTASVTSSWDSSPGRPSMRCRHRWIRCVRRALPNLSST